MLTENQQLIADRVLDEEGAARHHVVVCLSGAHAYGFPSPDSDLDIKCVHMAPTRSLLGLPKPTSVADRLEVIDGVEIDYTSNELATVVAGVLAGNGNFIERILGAILLRTSQEHEELAELTRASFSRRVFRHYAGFADSQRKALIHGDEPTAKRLLYVLRTILTGVHLLEAGELRVDLRENAPEYGYAEAAELIETKRRGEKVVLEKAAYSQWSKRLGGLFERLKAARDKSPLPETAPNADALEAWLVEARIARLEAS